MCAAVNTKELETSFERANIAVRSARLTQWQISKIPLERNGIPR